MWNSPLNYFARRNQGGRRAAGGIMIRAASITGLAAALLLNTPCVAALAYRPNLQGVTASQAAGVVRTLSAGRPVEGELRGGGHHSLQVKLTAGQFIRFVVTGHGIDVVASLFGPSGLRLREVPSLSTVEGEAIIFWVAETGGDYRLEVSAPEADARPGRYVAKVAELRASAPRDKSLLAAEDALAAGGQLLAGRTREVLPAAYDKFDEALSLLRSAGDLKRAAYAMRRKAFTLAAQGHGESALALFKEALRLTESEYGVGHLKVAPALWDIADTEARLGRLREARATHQRAQKIIETSAGAESLAAAIGLNMMANVLMGLGDGVAALDAGRRASRIYEGRYGPDSAAAASSLAVVASLLQRQGRNLEAQPLYERVLRAYTKRFGHEAPELIGTLFSLSQVMVSRGEGAAGLAQHARALRIAEKAYGVESSQAAHAHWEMGNILLYLRKPTEARVAYESSLKISPPVSPAAVSATLGVANAFSAERDYASARAKYDEAIKISEQVGGRDSIGVAYCLTAKVSAFRGGRDHAEGSQLYEKALRIYETIEGMDAVSVARTLAAAADYDEDYRKYQDARSKYERAMKIYEKKEGPDSVNAAFFQQKVGNILVEENRVDDGLVALRSALAKYEAIYGLNHPALIRPLKSLGRAYVQKNRPDEVRGILQRCLKILKDGRLEEELVATEMFSAEAGLNHAEGNFAAAHEAAGKAVKIYERNQDHRNPDDEIEARNIYALALLMDGKLPRARVEIEKTLALAEQRLGPNAPGFLMALTNMTTLMSAVGEDDKIARHVDQVMRLSQSLVEGGDPQAVRVLMMTGMHAVQVGKKGEARELMKKTSELMGTLAGPDNYVMTDLYTYQAFLLGALGDYAGAAEAGAKADRLFKQLDPELLTRALLLMTRGQIFIEQNKLPQARVTFEEGARIFEKRLGAKHYMVALGFNRLGWIHYLEGDLGQSRASYLKGAGATYHHVRDMLPTLSLAEQRLFLDREIPDQVSGLLATCRDGAALRSAYEPMFQWKGSLVDSLRRQTVITRLGRSGPHGARVKRLQDVRAEIAGWYYKLRNIPVAEWRQKNDELSKEKEDLERELGRALKSGELDDPLAAGLAGFQRLLGPDEVFLDVYLYTHWDKVKRNEERYAAVVTGPAGEPSLVDLGPALKINRAVTAWRNEVLSLTSAGAEWETLTKLLWRPLADALPPGARKVWVSPDAELARVPWQLLPAAGPGGKRLLLTQTDSARELARLRQRAAGAAPQAESIFMAGNINFDAGSSATARRVSSADFSRIDGAAAEMASLRAAGLKIRATVVPLTGAEASKENVVAGIQKATYAHIITHGFFSREAMRAATASRGLTFRAPPLGDPPPPNARNPLVESGIALAGANVRDPLALDVKGLLTAEEIIGLDLSRCELVTLSACETGRGAEVTGQGVMGLRASVMAAGARSMLMSLWKVPDEATVKFMEVFYDNLWAKKMMKAEALLSAQEAVRNHPSGKYRAPVFWAAWVLAGESW